MLEICGLFQGLIQIVSLYVLASIAERPYQLHKNEALACVTELVTFSQYYLNRNPSSDQLRKSHNFVEKIQTPEMITLATKLSVRTTVLSCIA